MNQQINPVLQPYASDPLLVFLLEACVGRLMSREGGGFAVNKKRLRHISDWLRAALANDEPWLKNVDDHGRPKKLLKFGSIDAIGREADKAMLKAAQKLCGVKLVDGDEELVEMLEDGYYVVRLLTPAALDRESSQMQHCIGNGGYDDCLKDRNNQYLSLRDPQGKAHATMEIIAGRLVQLQGKQNAAPIHKYLEVLIPYIRASGLAVDVPSSHLGHVMDIDGAFHPLENLPEGLKVKGNLDLADTQISTLPDGLWVGGYLSLSGTLITSLPKGLTVGDDLYLDGTPIAELPEGLWVRGDLDLNETLITALPRGLKVAKDLDLSDTPIDVLPDDLSVGGSLNLRRTKIAALPKGLSVGRHLNLRETQISELPGDLSVGKSVFLNDAMITALWGNIIGSKKSSYGYRVLNLETYKALMTRRKALSANASRPRL